MGRKANLRSLLFWIALLLSELEIVFQHRRISRSTRGSEEEYDHPKVALSRPSPTHDVPFTFPLAPSNYAYAFLVTECDPSMPESYQGTLFSVLVNAQVLEAQGSKADIVVMVKMAHSSEVDVLPTDDLALLNAFPRVVVRYLPKAASSSSSSPSSSEMFVDKFRILDLIQYRLVIYLDSDVMPLCNLDYLFHLSEKGVLKENLVLAGNDETINGGFMMLRPGRGEFQHLLSIIQQNSNWMSLTSNWGQTAMQQLSNPWTTMTTTPYASSHKQQELLYGWVKQVKKSASVFIENKVEQWSSQSGNPLDGSRPVLEATLWDVLKGYECPLLESTSSSLTTPHDHQNRPTGNLARQLWHFDDKQAKFWMTSDSNKLLSSSKTSYRPFQTWFRTLQQVKRRLNMTSSSIQQTSIVRDITSQASVENTEKKYAYAFVLAGVDPEKPKSYRGILFSILVNAQALESAGSTADIVVLVQMAYDSKSDYLPKEDASYLRAYPQITVHYMPRPPEPHSFYSSQFDKFRILELTLYSRVIYLDADATPLCSLDYLFHMSEQGVFKENMLLAGNNEPSNGGFMMLRPREGDYERVVRIIEARDAHILASSLNHTFDTTFGWGHVITPPDKWRTRYNKKSGIKWDFTTAFGNQGLMYYWAKYVKKDVSIFLGNEVDNWSSSSNLNQSTPFLEATLVDAIKGHECPTRMDFWYDKLAKPPYDLEGQLLHFWGKKRKPWMLDNMQKVLKGNESQTLAYRVWFQHLERVKQRLNIKLDVQKELRSNPALGSWTMSAALRKSLQRKHAYAFLLADVDPANPTQYRATMYGILVNVQLLEFFGSTADIVVMVQMAHNSEWDRLTEKTTASLKAYSNVVIHYLPKATRAPTFYSSQFEKFRVLELTRYRRVLYLDTDVMPVCSLDYLFHLSEKTFKENMILAGDDEPAKRGFMMLRPGAGEYQQLMSLIDKRDDAIWASSPNLKFDKINGWGHAIQPPDRWRSRYNVQNGTLWNFSAASGDQGLLYYWVKYVKKSASLFIGNEVENWSSSAVGTKSIPVLESTLVDALKGYACSTRSRFPRLEHAKPPFDLEGQMWHFNGVAKKPWNLKDLKKVLAVDKKKFRPYHMWFQLLKHVKKRLHVTINVEKQLRYFPKLVASTLNQDFKASLERRHAYAFLLAGVSPERPEGYKGILFSILVNAHRFESWGSNADIIVLVQMAHDSEWNYLPKDILKYLQAYPNIVIHYLPKPAEPPSFYSAQFDKFYTLELTQYRRILYLDADVLPLCNMDYLFHLSENGVFKENMLLAGNNEPSNGGFMMVRPGAGEYQKVRDIIDERDTRIVATHNKTFDKIVGWGHVIQPPDYWRTRYNRKSGTFWNFTTAFGNQGLMYHWAKYVKKSVSLFAGNEVENWGPPAVNSSDSNNPVLEETLVDAIQGHECPTTTWYYTDKYRKAPYDLEGQMRHFGGKDRKPWTLRNVTHVLRSNNDTQYIGYQMWFKAFEQVQRRLKIKVKLTQLRHDPKLGTWTSRSDFLASLERKSSNLTTSDVARK